MLNPDITIEVYSNPDKKIWSNLLVVECKNHHRKIDNSMYREFVGNLSDYPRSGVRGMMISSVGFTQQVIRLAQSDNIALAVLSEESNWETIIWRQINNFDQSQFKHKVLVGEFSTDYPIVYWGSSFITISDLLQECGIPIQKMLCCGILLMFSLLQRLKICWGTNWGRNFAGQKKKRANIESLFIPYRRFRFPKI